MNANLHPLLRELDLTPEIIRRHVVKIAPGVASLHNKYYEQWRANRRAKGLNTSYGKRRRKNVR